MHEERASTRVSRSLERALDLAGELSNVEREQLPPPRPSGRLSRLPGRAASGTQPIPEDCQWRRTWSELLEQLEPLPGRLRQLKAQPREVPAWACEALDKSLADGVRGANHHNGDRRGRLLERREHGSGTDDDIYLETDKLGCEVVEALDLALAPTGFGHEVLPIHVAELAQSIEECPETPVHGLRPGQIGGRRRTGEDSDPIDLARGLGAGNVRRREQLEGKAKARRSISRSRPRKPHKIAVVGVVVRMVVREEDMPESGQRYIGQCELARDAVTTIDDVACAIRDDDLCWRRAGLARAGSAACAE